MKNLICSTLIGLSSASAFAQCASYPVISVPSAIISEGVVKAVSINAPSLISSICYLGLQFDLSSVTVNGSAQTCKKVLINDVSTAGQGWSFNDCVTFQQTTLKILMTAKSLGKKLSFTLENSLGQAASYNNNGRISISE